MIVTDRHQMRAEFRQMRLNRKLSQRELATRLNLSKNAIVYRESGRFHMDLDAVLRTAQAFGYNLALIPARHPGARPTGTGWPA
jgi:transcriptional regulator with XRE-family HTH domain